MHQSGIRAKALWIKLLFGIVLSVPLQLGAQSQPLSLYLPLLSAPSLTTEPVGLGLSNPTSSDATVTLTARRYDGTLISGPQINNPLTITVPAGRQWVHRADEAAVFGPGISSQTGWLQVQSNITALNGLFTLFNSAVTFIDGAALQTVPAHHLIFPEVSASSIISFANTSSSSIPLAVAMYDNNGNLLGQTNSTLNSYSGFIGPTTGSAGALLPGIAAGTAGYLVVEAAENHGDVLVGTEIYQNQSSDIAALNAFPDSAVSRIGFIPHLAVLDGWVSRLALVNASDQSQTVNVSASNLTAGGQPLATVTKTLTIPANGRIETNVVSLFGLTGTTLIVGSIQWQTTGATPGVVGFLDYGTMDGNLLSAVPAQAMGFSDLFFSQVAQDSLFYTGLAILNPSSVDSSVIAIDVFAGDGSKTGSAVLTLGPGARQSSLLSQLIPALQTQDNGYIRLTASRPVMAFQLFGSNSETFLANVATQGSPLNPQSSGSLVKAATGAEVLSADGTISLLIPPGALPSDTPITISTPVITGLPAPSAGNQVVAAVQADPPTTFNIPVALTFPLSAQLDAGSQVQLLLFSDGSYQDSGFQAVVDPSGRTATARVTHFSTYVVPFSSSRILAVTGLTPTSGASGTSVTISGQGFSTTAGLNYVTFAGPDNTIAVGAVTAATVTSLTVTVPPAAISGNVVVRVGSQTSIGLPFAVSVNPRPAIFSITPNYVTSGTSSISMTIRGMGFQSSSTVSADANSLITTYLDQTQLQATLSAGQLSSGVHQIAVSNASPGGGMSNAVEVMVGSPKPAITGLAPSTVQVGPSPVNVTVTGTGFVPNSVVYVNGSPAPGSYVDSATMMVTLASSAAANDIIAVFNPSPGGGMSNSSLFAFTPGSSGPSKVVLMSSNTSFQAGSPGVTISAFIEDQNGNVVTTSTANVTFAVTSGIGTLTPTSAVAVAGIATTTITSNIADAGPLTVQGVSPGLTQGQVSIDVLPGPANNLFLSCSASVTAASLTITVRDQFGNTVKNAANTITLSALPSTGNPLFSTVSGPSSGIATSTFTATVSSPTSYTLTAQSSGLLRGTCVVTINPPPAPTLTSIMPSTGVTGTANQFTLTGTYFLSGATVSVTGGTAITVSNPSVSSSTSLTATFTIDPQGILGAYNVYVHTSSGTSGAVTFTVLPPAPVLFGLVPFCCVQGQTITHASIAGDHFIPGRTTVTIDPAVGSITVNSVTSTNIDFNIAINRNAPTGPHNITVTTPGGSASMQFIVYSIVPSSGVQGQTITHASIGGQFIPGRTTVTIDPAVGSITVNSVTSTNIDFNIAINRNAPTGPQSIIVTTPGGSAQIPFTVIAQ